MSDATDRTSSGHDSSLTGWLDNFARAQMPTFPTGVKAPSDPSSSADVQPTVPTAGMLALNHPKSIITRSKIRPGQADALRERLKGSVFTQHSPGVHNARFAVLDDEHLLFTAIYDVTRSNALLFLGANAANVDEVWAYCEGYPPSGAADLGALSTYLAANDEEVRLMFDAYIDPGEPQVREAIALRLNFLEFARAVQDDPGGALVHYTGFLQNNRRRIVAYAERHLGDLEREYTVVPGNKTTAFTMMSKVKFSIEAQAKLRAVLGFGNFVVNEARINPIADMVTVHYARFGLWDVDKLLFASVYDGDWVQYVEDFSTRIPFQMDKVWGNCVGWPEKGAADTPA
ncbi:MAG: hypothetical protein K0V04_35705, partial [Deltaproteobacteria bacterium]|nr:hypothetical protein [Deltaproteobacteria bacterium]